MRTIKFHIENNGHMLSINQIVEVKEYKASSNYFYVIENSIGMSKPFSVRERLNSSKGKVLEIKNDGKFNIAVLEFDE